MNTRLNTIEALDISTKLTANTVKDTQQDIDIALLSGVTVDMQTQITSNKTLYDAFVLSINSQIVTLQSIDSGLQTQITGLNVGNLQTCEPDEPDQLQDFDGCVINALDITQDTNISTIQSYFLSNKLKLANFTETNTDTDAAMCQQRE